MVYKGPLGPRRFFMGCGCNVLTGLFVNESQHWPDGLGLSRAVTVKLCWTIFARSSFIKVYCTINMQYSGVCDIAVLWNFLPVHEFMQENWGQEEGSERAQNRCIIDTGVSVRIAIMSRAIHQYAVKSIKGETRLLMLANSFGQMRQVQKCLLLVGE